MKTGKRKKEKEMNKEKTKEQTEKRLQRSRRVADQVCALHNASCKHDNHSPHFSSTVSTLHSHSSRHPNHHTQHTPTALDPLLRPLHESPTPGVLGCKFKRGEKVLRTQQAGEGSQKRNLL
jgi:hypothetical protein